MKISACLIGEDSLLIQCAELFIKRKHNIVAIVTDAVSIQNWAHGRHLKLFSHPNDLLHSDLSFDYLFSIVNSHILNEDLIKLARCSAINYHDSLLPNYAGLHATSWALINGEEKQGVTWHLIEKGIDTGPIVYQEWFKVETQDTALSLNLKCYQTAIKSCEQLIKKIEQGTLYFEQQSIEKRSYYPRDHLLPNLGFIDWRTQSVEELLRLQNALTFGHYSNPIGTLKLYLDHAYFIVSKLEESEEQTVTKPGTVFFIKENSFHISTRTKPVKILELVSMEGRILTGENMLHSFFMKQGCQLPVLKNADQVRIQAWYKQALVQEKEVVSQFVRMQDHAIVRSFEQSDWIMQPKLVLESLIEKNDNSRIFILITVLVHLYRLNGYEELSVFLVRSDVKKLQGQCADLISIFLPFLFKIPNHFSFKQILEWMKTRKEWIHLTDLKWRYPELRDKNIAPLILINTTKHVLELSSLPEQTILYIQINTNGLHAFHRLEQVKSSTACILMNHFSEHIRTMLTDWIKHPDKAITQVNYLSKSEQETLFIWGRGQQYVMPNRSISELIEEQIRCRPNHRVILFEKQSITYAELGLMSKKVASCLANRGYLEQSFIGIYFDRSVEMLAAILGILKQWAVYIPIDTQYPLKRVEQIIRKTNLSIIITQEKYMGRLRELINTVTLISDQSIVSGDYPEKEINLSTQPLEQLAYIMFTSGSTGEPKAVMITQRNLLNYCYWFLETTRFNAESIVDFSSSIAFDLSIPCTFAPLLAGGTIALCSEQSKLDPKKYLAHLVQHQVTHVEMTPGYLNLLLHYPKEIRALYTLRYLLLGADALSKEDILKWLELCPRHTLINEYGPTETTVAVTAYVIQAQELKDQPSIPIGRPGYNVQCYVLDQYNNLCPIGMPGELCVSGAQVSPGYFEQDDITAKRFITIELDTKKCLYKTGDKVVWSSEGLLYCLGRTDRQVKIQGYRIELSEIESVLQTMPGVQKATVILIKTQIREAYLKAYLICDIPFEEENAIQNFLSSHLPKFMLPREFAVMNKIPLKENEKIDHKHLEEYSKTLLHQPINDASDIAKTIQTIWQDALNHPMKPQIHDHFFDLGGDSLSAIYVIDHLQKRYSINIPLRILFECPTITALEKEIGQRLAQNNINKINRCNNTPSIVPLAKGRSKYPLFLIHPVGGTVFWYRSLADLLQENYTLYGLQDPNVDGYDIHFSTLQEMAAYYLEEVKKIQPLEETYYLAGASFGATVVFEMAYQLIQDNKQVAFLGLLDGWAHYPDRITAAHSSELLFNSQLIHAPMDIERKNKLIRLEKHREKLLSAYSLPKLNLDVHLFKAKELWPLFQTIQNEYNGWRPYITGKISVHTVLGTHETMFLEPCVCDLANIMKQQLKYLYLKQIGQKEAGMIQSNVSDTQLPLYLEQIISAFQGYVGWKDRIGSYLGGNDHLAKLSGFKNPKELIGKTDHDFAWSQGLIEQFIADDRQVMERKQSIKKAYKLPTKREDGAYIHILRETRPLYDHKHQVIGTLCIAADITDQKRNELMRLETLIEHLPCNVYWMDKDCMMVGCNRNVLSMLGMHTLTEFSGKTYEQLEKLCHWPKGLAQKLKNDDLSVLDTGQPILGVEDPPIPHTNGTNLYLLTNRVPIRDKYGEIVGVAGISVDISDRKKLEENLRQAKELAESANRAKDAFIMNMAHDIRTPLTGMIHMSEDLTEMVINNEEALQRAQLLQHASRRLHELLESVLELSKAEHIQEDKIKKESVDLRKIAHNLNDLLLPSMKEKGLAFQLEIDPNLPPYLETDRLKLERVLLNLTSNAIKFTKQGKIHLICRCLSKRKGKAKIELCIRDTGIGIPEDQLEKVFDRFVRLNPSYSGVYKGHGVGLFIVKKYVEILGGSIQVESTLGQGTQFTIHLELPIAQQEETNPTELKPCTIDTKTVRKAQRSVSATESGPRILLIEDNFGARLGAQSCLKRAGYHVITAENVLNAFKLLKEQTFDLVLSDIGLPDGNGMELTQQYRAWEKKNKKTHTPIIALTGHAGDEAKEKCLVSGMDQVIRKPLEEDDIQALNQWIEQAKSKDLNTYPLFDEALARTLFDETDLQELIQVSLTSWEEVLPMFKQAHEQQDWKTIAFQAHKLRGGSTYVAATQLHKVCAALSEALSSGDTNIREALFKQLIQTIGMTKKPLQAWLSKQSNN